MRHRAQVTIPARSVRPHNAVAFLQTLSGSIGLDIRPQTHHPAYHLVAENDRQRNARGNAKLALPQMHVGAANRRNFRFHQNGARLNLVRNRHVSQFERLLIGHDTRGTTRFGHSGHTVISQNTPCREQIKYHQDGETHT